MFSAGVPGQKPIIGEVDQQSIAWEANIRSGDEIVSVGDRNVKHGNRLLISMIGEVLEDEQIAIQLIDSNGSQKNALLDVTGEQKNHHRQTYCFPDSAFLLNRPILNQL